MYRSILGGLLGAVVLAGAAGAQTCQSFPYTLTDGAVADANQVMADFNCVALLGQTVAFGQNTEKLSLNSGSIGFNRAVTTGQIYNTSAYAYQFQHTEGSTSTSDYLALQIYYPSGGNFSAAALEINAGGQVSIGGGTQPGWLFTSNGQAGGVYSWAAYSDARLKTNVTTLTGGLALLQHLRPVRYNWLPAASRTVGQNLPLPVGVGQIGFIAQEVEQVVPEAVTPPQAGSSAPYSLMEAKLIPVLVEAIKEQQAEIAQLQAQVATLTAARK